LCEKARLVPASWTADGSACASSCVLVGDNWGWHRHQVEIGNLNFLKPHVIKALQATLAGYPNWSVSVQVDVPESGVTWPGMGLIIYDDEIEDDLRREYLPEEFRTIVYEGSRPANGGRDVRGALRCNYCPAAAPQRRICSTIQAR
jgi:hypothetical protein